MHQKIVILSIILAAAGCNQKSTEQTTVADIPSNIKPLVVTEPAAHDTDDPAIWINKNDPSKSLIIGTDKGGDEGVGRLYVYDLKGHILQDKTVLGIKRPNNVDIAYGLTAGDKMLDIAVCTERYTNSIRIFSLPDMKPLDNGGIEVFEGDSLRDPMGIALYTDPSTNEISAIVGRKSGPTDSTYLWQYSLIADSSGMVKTQLVRKFGAFSGIKEIESIAVDNELGYVYYSDEGTGIHKYYAHPDSTGVELALFGSGDFKDDNEGISIYKMDGGKGYILVSDQQANRFNVYPREGSATNQHEHMLLGSVNTSTNESDGSDVTAIPLGSNFPNGLFVAMSDDKTFQLYSWNDIFQGLEQPSDN
ncbi:phytase [Fulvivirga lutimaris]|uniref:phytase n=1 Tax=Fulvivirga lutimaris TaxID=1819566 RepID=UPI0012BB6BAD|nr:phytase [Fulvivirga lutimaris]MTI41184.1 phytase [Fulvivirga lutimaris]